MQTETADDEVLAVIEATGPRRLLGSGMMGALGVILIYVAMVQPPEVLGWQVFLIVTGAAAIWTAERLWRATAARLELTRAVLRDSSGETLVRLSEIRNLDRGMFAFKPSNGFILRLKTPHKGAWRPGLWWRFGRRIGVGGVTPGSQAKFMAEMIQGLLAAGEQN